MTERYQEDGKLALLATEILDAYKGDALNDAKAFSYRIIFTNTKLGHEEVAGKCTKIEGPVRFLWGVDFIIQIQKQEFEKMTALDKVRILGHELHHIGKDEHDEPQMRRHSGDFCEIAAHDKLSYSIARQIYKNLENLKEFATQSEVIVEEEKLEDAEMTTMRRA